MNGNGSDSNINTIVIFMCIGLVAGCVAGVLFANNLGIGVVSGILGGTFLGILVDMFLGDRKKKNGKK